MLYTVERFRRHPPVNRQESFAAVAALSIARGMETATTFLYFPILQEGEMTNAKHGW